MQKKVLAEQALYYGDVSMPKGFEIDSDKLTNNILQSSIQNKELPFTKTWDMLNTYIREHIKLDHDLSIANKLTWGNIFKPNETTPPLLNIDPVDLRNSPDFVLLYGIKVDNCSVQIHYDDNRRKGKSWDIPIVNNKFIMFPSMCMYYLTNKQKDSLNFVQTITYEYI